MPPFPQHILRYDQPARLWNESLPIGNGRMGAMVHGGIHQELLHLNDDTLYSGEPDTRSLTPDLAKDFDTVRRLLDEERYAEAEEIITAHWLGVTHTSYQPLADLHLEIAHTEPVSDYLRTLNLADGICSVSYTSGGTHFTREVFASHPADVLVYRLDADRPGQLSFTASLQTPHPGASFRVDRNGIGVLSGRAPLLAMKRSLQQLRALGDTWKYPELFDAEGNERPDASTLRYESGENARGMRFAVCLRIETNGGEVQSDSRGFHIIGADSATLILSSGTSFSGFNRSPSREGCDPEEKPRAAIERIPDDYSNLRKEHVRDFASLFGRMDICLASNNPAFTNARPALFSQGADPAFAALRFQFARYLMISASRPHSQAMNLQGIWNTQVVPPWNGAYTLNINTQMNYWLAEAGNLAECHEPLLQLICEAAENGARLAREIFHRNGWVCFHHIGIWRDVQPSDGQACWAFWPMAQAWLCAHLWQHFEYSGNLTFLREEAYPLLKGASEFLLDWLVEDASGCLVTPVGVSPENTFSYFNKEGIERTATASPGPAMDISLTRECLSNCLRAAEILGLDREFQLRISEALLRIAPCQIGTRGELQEWSKNFKEVEPEHRHVSHLYGLYPGNEFRNNPGLLAAARKSLDLRGDRSTGWSTAWKAALRARTGDGEHALRLLHKLHGPDFCLPNLFNAEPVFQIDANFGSAAALLEMLIQSHPDVIEILPALPAEFGTGAIRGVRTRGGFELDFSWRDSCLQDLCVRSLIGRICRLRTAGHAASFPTNAGISYRLGADFSFSSEGAGGQSPNVA